MPGPQQEEATIQNHNHHKKWHHQNKTASQQKENKKKHWVWGMLECFVSLANPSKKVGSTLKKF